MDAESFLRPSQKANYDTTDSESSTDESLSEGSDNTDDTDNTEPETDTMTKSKPCLTLKLLVDTNKLDL